MSVIVANANNQTDGSAYEFLRQIPTDIPIVLVARCEDFKFNEELNSLKRKKWILADYIENGWQWDMKEGHLWGENTFKFDFLCRDEWKLFDNFVYDNPPALSFVRELLEDDVAENKLPIEYPNLQQQWPIQSKEEYLSRIIDVFYFWGRSNEMRVQLHGDIWKGATHYNYSVNDNIYYFNDFVKEERGSKWVSYNIPHYGRQDVRHLLSINAMSKLSVSLPGNGVKCFRTTGESPVNSLMVTTYDTLAYTFPFTNSHNCIKFSQAEPTAQELNKILSTPPDHLFEMYVKCVETANKYRLPNYIHYLQNLINKA